ncbi:hypothetical protein NI17_020485 [Thermobifida halotolerans]|uniref:Uncharacterized protein n=1 Tax=Thermobifida halotolerans TaxID=483545 RepID=A0A399G065_9ACTN|nr:hypothetical protein [Thermobifida halotolerans]UOE19106.1 hypothetical protein NI17_020485 [Thermobifida halotolerans]
MDQVLESRGSVGASAATVHGDPLPRRAGRWLVRAFLPSDDVLAAVEVGAAVQRPILTGRRIVVDGPRGGVERSAVTALLALVFAHYRQDRVLALDVDPGTGSLARRFGVRTRRSLTDVADANPPDSFEAVEPLLSSVRERLWTLPGAREEDEGDLGARIYRGALLPLSRFFGITLIHSGTGLPTELHDAVSAGAHAHVLVAPETGDGVVGVGRMLDTLLATGGDSLTSRIVVVLVAQETNPDPTFDLVGAVDILTEGGVGVFRLGRDRHLAATTVIDPRRLAQATHTTMARVAAEVLRRSL